MKLYPHQEKVLNWAKDKTNLACFLEMRLGKSFIAIHQCFEWNAKRILLIAPLSSWYDWKKLLNKYGERYQVLEGSTKKKQQSLANMHCKTKWVIINPEGLTYWGKDFFKHHFDVCIIDESPVIKNPKAKITKLLLKHRDCFSHRLIMTGTPIAETTEDVVTQLIFCHGEFLRHTNFYSWRMHYMYPSKFNWRLKKGVKDLLRRELKQQSYILSAKDVGMFAPQSEQTYYCELPNNIAKDYHHIQRCWQLDKASTKFGVVKDIWLARLACGLYPRELSMPNCCHKTEHVKEICNNQLVDQQVLICSRWVDECYHVATELNALLVTGNTPFEERERALNLFRRGDRQYIVFQTKTACRGLDLSCADNAIIMSNYWQHEIRKQLKARLNHPMKRKPTLIIDIIAKDTIEEHVYDILEKKRLNARSILHQLKVRMKCKR